MDTAEPGSSSSNGDQPSRLAPRTSVSDAQETSSFLDCGHLRKTSVAKTRLIMEKQRQALP